MRFAEGSAVAADTILYCTGYRIELKIISSTLLLTPQVHMANRQATRDIALQVSLPFPVPGPGRAHRRRQPRRAAVRARLPAQVRSEPLLRRGAIQGTPEPQVFTKNQNF